MAKYVGKRMKDIVSFVESNPGLTMYRAAKSICLNRFINKGYDAVHRAIEYKLILAVQGPDGSTLLYPIKNKENETKQQVSV